MNVLKSLAVIFKAGLGTLCGQKLTITNTYHAKSYDADGNLIGEGRFTNLIPTVGLNYILDNFWAGSGYTATIYMGLIDGTSATYAAGDTMSSHGGWTENTSYSQSTRPAPAFSAASGGVKATSSDVTFSTTASGNVIGCFLTTNNTKGGTTGTILSEGSFTGSYVPISNNGTVTVSFSSALTSS